MKRAQTRWRDSWLCQRVELNDGLLGACRHERVRPKLAVVALAGLLLGQTLLPGAMLISTVHADEVRRAEVVKAPRETAVPAWAKTVEAQAKAEEREHKLRLAQLVQPAPGEGEQTATEEIEEIDEDCVDCDIDVRELDLSKVPTEKELRRAGGFGGALNPLNRAEPGELGVELDLLLKNAGIEEGLRAELPPTHPHFGALKRAKEKYERARAINLDFGQAIQEWNRHNYVQAAQMFKKHLKDYPESPWAGEAALHLGCDAKYNGRFAEAQQIYSDLFQATSEAPNPELKARKLARRANGGAEPTAKRNANIARALQGAQSLEEAVAKLAAPDEADDESFELHQKAKLRWADLDLAMGHFADASQKLGNIIQTDTDWRRRTWARYWLQTSQFYLKNAPQLMACGPRALGLVLASLHKDKGAERVRAAVAPRAQGFSLSELQTLAAKNGVPMRGFKGDVGELAHLPLPAILHYDFGKEKSAPALDGRGASPFHLSSSGHFVVLQKVDAKRGLVSLFDPLEQRPYQMTYAQLNRQWSGQGLALATGKARLASAGAMDAKAMKTAIGGCCGVPTKPDGLGHSRNNDKPCNGPCGGGYGSPMVEFNRATMNMFVYDTPLWYNPSKGPAVEITMSYNSQDSTNQHEPFGKKWMFNYGSYVVLDTGGRMEVAMPDGSRDLYTPTTSGASTYVSEAGNYKKLSKSTATRWVLTFQDGSRWVYDVPAGVNTAQSLLVRMDDRWNNSLNFGYDGLARLTTITDALNQVTLLSYNSNDTISNVTDPFGRSATFSYSSGKLTGVTDMVGQRFEYAYDADKNITLLNTAQGNWQFVHEGPDGDRSVGYYPPRGGPMWDNRRITITDPANQKQEYYWDGTNGRSWHVARNDYVTSPNPSPVRTGYSFVLSPSNGKNRISQISYPDGTTESYSYDFSRDAVNRITDRRGKVTTLTYNNEGQVTTVTDPKSNLTRINYASNNLDATSVVNAYNFTVMTATYDVKHQLKSITDKSNNGTTTFTYTNWGAPDTTIDAQNRGTRNLYFGSGASTGFLATVQYSDAPTTTGGTRTWVTVGGFTYDPKGRVASATDAANLTMRYLYDDLDRSTATIYPDNTRDEVSYFQELPAVVKDRAGRQTFYTYDSLKRLKQMQDAQGNLLKMDYDANGNLLRLTDAKNNLTQWGYDALDRATTKQYHDGTSEAYTYTGGLLSQTRGTRGQLINYQYDDNGNRTKIDYPNTPDVTLTYNVLNDVSIIDDGIGRHALGYDGYGRMTYNDGPIIQGDLQTYSYDALQRLDTQTAERGASGGTQSQSYAYDALGRLKSINSNGTQSTGLTQYSYDGDTERLTQRSHPNGNVTNRQYDDLGRVTRILNRANGDTYYNRYQYTYDTRDVITKVVGRTGGGSTPYITDNYLYDAIDQLKQEQVTGGATNVAFTDTYAYDAMGNRTTSDRTTSGSTVTTTYVTNALNQMKSATTFYKPGETPTNNYDYDAAGNLTQKTAPDGSKTLYTYDDADRLYTIERRSASNAPLSLSQFDYDYAGRNARTYEAFWARDHWEVSDEKRRVFDGMDVIQERNGANQVTAQLVRDGNIGGILSRTTSAGTAFYDYDAQGNVTLLTDANGNDVGHYRYDAFGNTLEAVGTRAAENPYRFSTKELHADSGLYNFGYRFYDSGTGRWINRDPLGEAGGANLYGFVGNNPVNYVDDYGDLPRPLGGPALMSNGSEAMGGAGGKLSPGVPSIPVMGGGGSSSPSSDFDRMMAERMDGVNPWMDAPPLGAPMYGMAVPRVPNLRTPRISPQKQAGHI